MAAMPGSDRQQHRQKAAELDALPAGFAASPRLTGITVMVSCTATPGCSPADPCESCREIRDGLITPEGGEQL